MLQLQMTDTVVEIHNLFHITLNRGKLTIVLRYYNCNIFQSIVITQLTQEDNNHTLHTLFITISCCK